MIWAQFLRSCVSQASCWHYGSIPFSDTRGGRFKPFCCDDKYFCYWIRWIQYKHLGKTLRYTMESICWVLRRSSTALLLKCLVESNFTNWPIMVPNNSSSIRPLSNLFIKETYRWCKDWIGRPGWIGKTQNVFIKLWNCYQRKCWLIGWTKIPVISCLFPWYFS